MLRVILVDDDPVIRTYLKTLIEWEQYGFTIVDETNNGVECIQKMSTGSYDLVITDMEMPVMDGVALIESIRRYYPEVEVIVISTHDDYNYVRDSLRKGAIDYILKHKLSKEILSEALESTKKKITEHNKLLYRSSLQSEQLAKGRFLMLHSLVNNILAGDITHEEAKQKFEMLEISFGFTNFILCYMEVLKFPAFGQGNKDQIIKSFIDMAEKIIMEEDGQGFVVYLEEENFIAFLDFEKIKSSLLIHQNLAGILFRICSVAKKFMSLHVSAAVSSLSGDYERIPELFQKTKLSLQNKFYEEQQTVWPYNEMPKAESQMSLSIKDEENIIQFLEKVNKEGLLNFLDSLFNKCREKNVSVHSVQVICSELISIAIQFCIKQNLIVLRDELRIIQSSDDYLNKKFTELRNYIKQIFDKVLTEYVSLQDERGRNSYVMKAMQYINSNYRNNISLTDTAEYVGVSAQYLSRLINEECEKGFAELLNGKRVEVACEMIRSHIYKVKEIVKKAGFNNYNYFFKVFKDVTGLTPAEYERQHICMQSLVGVRKGHLTHK